MEQYQKLEKIGEGTYGKVYLALDKRTNTHVALKKMLFESGDEGIPSTALREVSLLRELSGHPNVVPLLDVVYQKRTLFLVFEFVDLDLKRLMDQRALRSAEARSYMYQLLQGINFCHRRRILHRDLKPQNILVSKEGSVKLADFGLGRAYSVPLRSYTHEVVTMWYRAPEILLGQECYSVQIDVWALGCIFVEMFTGKPLFPGDSEIDQLFRMFRTFGTPTEESWPGVTSLANYQPVFPQYQEQSLRSHYQHLSRKDHELFDLMESMLIFNPGLRISTRAALNHSYFSGSENFLAEMDKIYSVNEEMLAHDQDVAAHPTSTSFDNMYSGMVTV